MFLHVGWWERQDSNPQPSRYERPALTIELHSLFIILMHYSMGSL